MLGQKATGNWSAFEVGLLVARQNGKGEILLARELFGLYLGDERLIMHSAHEFKTAAEAFLRIKAVIDGAPHLSKLVAKIRTSHGDEGIELVSGSRLRFVARSRSSGRGFTGDTILLDEAQQLPRSAVGALLPTLSARPNPQVIYAGTVPGPENDAEHFTSVRDRGRKGVDPGLAWLEWSAGEVMDDLWDRDLWAASNPALGFRITDETIERECNAMGVDDVKRERFSVWGDDLSKSIIPAHDWTSCRSKLTDKPTDWIADPVTLGVDLTPDRRWGSIVAAGACTEGGIGLDVVDHQEGPDWIVPRLVGIWGKHKPKALMIDPRSAAGSFIRELEQAGIEVTKCDTADLVKATGGMFDDIVGHRVRHVAQPELDAAVVGATKRIVGDSWLWDRRAGTVVAPLVAATLARWGHLEVEEPPARIMF
jgi:hypothetical protein